MAKPAFKPATEEVLENLNDEQFVIPGNVDDLYEQARANAPFADPEAPKIRRGNDTEDLLNGMIAECHYLMRDVVMPTACRATHPDTRARFLSSAMALAETGGHLAKVVAKLRKADRVAT